MQSVALTLTRLPVNLRAGVRVCFGGVEFAGGATWNDIASAVGLAGVSWEDAGVVALLHDDEGHLGAVAAPRLHILAGRVYLRQIDFPHQCSASCFPHISADVV